MVLNLKSIFQKEISILTKSYPLKSNSNHSNFEQIDDSLSQIDLKDIKKIETKKTILIVEDNPELKNYLRNELKNIYKIKTAENGQEGLEKALKFMPDIIITDIMMPIMDGFEFCEKVKNDIRISHIPLMMMTAKGMQIDKIKGIDSGADVYITKPFNMSVMKSHIKQLITSRQILLKNILTVLKMKTCLNNIG